MSASPNDSESALLAELRVVRWRSDFWRSADGEALVDRLCVLATHRDPDKSALGQKLLFSELVEPWADAFTADGAALYDHVFARVLDFCRRLPQAASLDAALSRFGLRSREDLLARKARFEPPPLPPSARADVRRIFVPSRITLGADVAITSVVLQKLERVFPQADCVLLGPRGLESVVGGALSVRLVEQGYDRRGGLLGRLQSWVRLVETVDHERGRLRPDQLLVVDPDSRLTQLGLLPVLPTDVATFFFPSRSWSGPERSSIGHLAAAWLDETFGADDAGPLVPRVWLRPSDAAVAGTIAARLRADGRRLVAVNLGVGDNPRKRVAGSFEQDLVRALLADGFALILDKGIGEERARVGAIVAGLEPLPSHVFVYEGAVGPFAALIRESDLYVGYDSAFQHIAAAQEVPVLDMFVDSPSPLFAERWRPHSSAAVRVLRLAPSAAADSTVGAVMEAVRAMATRSP